MFWYPNIGGSITTLTPCLEDYIEAIFNISNEKQIARSKDIKKALQVHGATVTGALQALSEKGMINYTPYEVITLTPKGYKIAQTIAKRHEILKDFLVNTLGIESFEAEKVACGMEHSLTPTVTMRLAAFVDLFKKNPDLHKMCQDSYKAFLNKFENETLGNCVKKDEVKRGEL